MAQPRGWLPSWARSWATDSAALLFSQFTAVLATSALAILLARHLGPRDWGVFSGFLGLSLALSIFIEFGLTQWLLRELTHLVAAEGSDPAPDSRRRTAGSLVVASVAVNLAFGTILTLAAAAAAITIDLGTRNSVVLVALVAYGALIASCYGIEAVFRSRRKLRLVVGATLLEKALLLLLVCIVLLLHLDLVAIGLAYLVAGVAHVVFDVTFVVRKGDVEIGLPSLQKARYVIRESVPFALNRGSLNIIPLLDTVVLSVIAPVAAGYFALGARALGPIIIIPVVMSSALYPFLTGESPESKAGWRVVGALGAAGCVVGAVGIVLTPLAVPFVFGHRYTPAAPTVQIMLGAVPFIFATNPLLTHVYTSRRERLGLALTLTGIAVLGTVAIVAGQELIGPTGAAAGFVARQALFLTALAIAAGVRLPLARSAAARGEEPRPLLGDEAPRATVARSSGA